MLSILGFMLLSVSFIFIPSSQAPGKWFLMFRLGHLYPRMLSRHFHIFIHRATSIFVAGSFNRRPRHVCSLKEKVRVSILGCIMLYLFRTH